MQPNSTKTHLSAQLVQMQTNSTKTHLSAQIVQMHPGWPAGGKSQLVEGISGFHKMVKYQKFIDLAVRRVCYASLRLYPGASLFFGTYVISRGMIDILSTAWCIIVQTPAMLTPIGKT